MRTKKSLKNALFSMLSNSLIIFIGVLAQTIFIKTLGSEFLGLNSLFTNIVSMLSIVELGIGNAIVFHLYKPIYNKDIEMIKSLMNFYKKAYHIIAIIVLIFGLILMPFLNCFVGENSLNINIYFVFFLFVIDASISYLLSYKRSILYADQKNYIINIIHLISVIFMNIFQVIILLLYKNYIIYLIIKILFRFLENILISIYVDKKYQFLSEKNVNKLTKNVIDDIKIKVKSLFMHQIGGFCVNGTDNLIISYFLGLVSVGLYSNYYLIINSINTIYSQSFSAITSSVGNLLVSKDNSKKMLVFKRLNFANFFLSTITASCLFLLLQDFIVIWVGGEYLLSIYIVYVLCNNYFLQTMKRSVTVFKEAAGIYFEDRFVPIIESLVNLISSIILLSFFGLIGVFIGTIISSFVLHFYSYPKYVYKKVLDGKHCEYIWNLIKQTITFNLILLFSYLISTRFNFLNIYLRLFVKLLIAVLIPTIFLIILNLRNNNLKYYLDLIKNKIIKRGASNDI